MGWIVKNLKCQACGHEFEDLYKNGEEAEVECPSCGVLGECVVDGISSPALGTYSMADAAGKSAILKKRSLKHTEKKAIPEWKEKQRAKVKAGKK